MRNIFMQMKNDFVFLSDYVSILPDILPLKLLCLYGFLYILLTINSQEINNRKKSSNKNLPESLSAIKT